MGVRIAINGFGRIGRMVTRVIHEMNLQDSLNIVAINDLAPAKTVSHLYNYDSVHGRALRKCHVLSEDRLEFGDGQSVRLFSQKDPQTLPWKDLDIDLVLECSGLFTKRIDAQRHIEAGAKKVFISAPSPDADITVVYGVNHTQLNDSHHVISNASCTTNCLAPIAKILDDCVGIDVGYMTTIHAYTGDQRLVDSTHSDLQRSRAACESMIPSTTGAAKAVGLVLPHLKGRLDGTSIRVPVSNVSVVDFKFCASRPANVDTINQYMIEQTRSAFKNIVDVVTEPLVSKDFNHQPFSALFDAAQTSIVDGRFVRVLAWYDNEWGFSNRMVDVIRYLYR